MELGDFLFIGTFMFACGVVCAVSRKNSIGVLMGIELILNGAGVNFIGFSRLRPTLSTAKFLPFLLLSLLLQKRL